MSIQPLVLDVDGSLVRAGARPVLRLAAGWSAVEDATGAGMFLRMRAGAVAPYVEQTLGTVAGLERFTSLTRFSPFWTKPAIGKREADVRPETLWLLAESGSKEAVRLAAKEAVPAEAKEAGRPEPRETVRLGAKETVRPELVEGLRAARGFDKLSPNGEGYGVTSGARALTLIVPLLDGPSRFSLRGAADGLAVAGETGDSGIACTGGVAVFVAAGNDPYELVAAGARAVQRQLGSGRLRIDKPVPDIADLFGWCTWDAFYKDVSADKVLDGLASFARAGVPPRLLILDDGWQIWQAGEGGEDRLMSLAPNERFGGDLTSLVQAAKSRFGIQRFMVWHALLGYWGGLDDKAFADYGARTVARLFGPGVLEQEPRWNVRPWGSQHGVPASDRFTQFYDDWHADLARQGVDGVKVDVQAVLEAVSAGQGGRVALARASRRALEASVARHFDGRLINCMACTSECAYLSEGSTLLRSSDDFFPNSPDSHGLHLHVNALAGMWFGEFMQPDWDMFQSEHPRAAFHAAARAISGGPVYVSDRVGEHDAELLRKLVLSDGSVLRADLPGRPTADTLFADPTREAVLLKIYNRNRDCGVVGLFHVAQHAEPITARVSPADVAGLAPAHEYVAWAHRANRLWRCSGDEVAFTLAEGEWELVSFAPVEHGFAAIGLADKFNSTGAIVVRSWRGSSCRIELRDGGAFLAWAERAPATLLCDDKPLAFVHDPTSGRLHADVPAGARRTLVLTF